jgi:Flp pilus assembly protein TadD
MSRKQVNNPTAPSGARTATQQAPANQPNELTEVLAKGEAALESGDPARALDLLSRSKTSSHPLTNLRAVCLLRLGKTTQAMEMLRSQVVNTGGVCLRYDVPEAMKINFATSLLLSGNVSGSQSILQEVQNQEHPGVLQLREAIRKWKQSLSFWEKFRWWMGMEITHPVEADFTPGVLH